MVERINSMSIEFDCEVAAAQLYNCNEVIIALYRSPSGSFEMMLENLEAIIGMFDSSSRVILCEDFNFKFELASCDYKNRDLHEKAAELCHMLSSCGFRRTILEPTGGGNCVDNIFINFST
ncbi:hypothetical protein WA026_019604 [Henosepilachna vigintioctopunctata]|uniref:Endonuclease/exonuclease/phosphatase domain-containing protein n=1 Tax=Henosepilachna vigintioctopunctata TaxID=420089 RepID=A0AAW1TW31_9CUCU